jgi:cyclophilin family peptidyl-prolyl cis-trans isomerase
MIQGGCPDGTGMGGPGYQIKGEFSANGVANAICHKRGVISMARAMHPDSAGSQFFIMHRDAPHLDGQYAAFGRVVEASMSSTGSPPLRQAGRTGRLSRRRSPPSRSRWPEMGRPVQPSAIGTRSAARDRRISFTACAACS